MRETAVSPISALRPAPVLRLATLCALLLVTMVKGVWVFQERTGKPGKPKAKAEGWKKSWWAKTWKEDWACHICDDQSESYAGNYGSDSYCRICGGHKGDSNHMTMATRSWHLMNGTLKTPEEMRAARMKNQKGGKLQSASPQTHKIYEKQAIA